MTQQNSAYQSFLEILRTELIPAMGCTEPIAVAFAAARCRELLAEAPASCRLVVSGPIIKNVKSVVVPHTGGRKGLDTAVAAGVLGGDAQARLEVLSCLTPSQQAQIPDFLSRVPIRIIPYDGPEALYIGVFLQGACHSAEVILKDYHTRIFRMTRDGETVYSEEQTDKAPPQALSHAMTVESIWEFVNAADPDDLRPLLDPLIRYNSAISREGLEHPWGAQIGRILLRQRPDDVLCRAKAAAAAGSDARMSGCEMPVVIVSGSGNQGITVALPVLEYARALQSDETTLLRALALASLTAVHVKAGMGRVSAFCGAVCAGVGAGCGVAYLSGGDLITIQHTVVNALGILSGMVCDGAKPSCAAKIAAAVDAGVLGFQMYREGQQFYGGDGIIKKGVENTISAVNELASQGMRQTDRCILDIMVR